MKLQKRKYLRREFFLVEILLTILRESETWWQRSVMQTMATNKTPLFCDVMKKKGERLRYVWFDDQLKVKSYWRFFCSIRFCESVIIWDGDLIDRYKICVCASFNLKISIGIQQWVNKNTVVQACFQKEMIYWNFDLMVNYDTCNLHDIIHEITINGNRIDLLLIRR